MKISDVIADMILDMFDDNKSTVQIQRNDLAARVGCVPSQINYVITSRFTPEQGYRIESRRGGGGCILITRADSKNQALMALINSIGPAIDVQPALPGLDGHPQRQDYGVGAHRVESARRRRAGAGPDTRPSI